MSGLVLEGGASATPNNLVWCTQVREPPTAIAKRHVFFVEFIERGGQIDAIWNAFWTGCNQSASTVASVSPPPGSKALLAVTPVA